MDCVISELFYKGKILQKNNRKMTINTFVKLHGKKFWSHNLTVLFPKSCYNEVCYKGRDCNVLDSGELDETDTAEMCYRRPSLYQNLVNWLTSLPTSVVC